MRNIKLRPDLPFIVPEIEDITDTLPKHKSKVYPTLNIEDIDTLTFHHMASDAPLIAQANYHVNVRGWAALGYKMVVYKGRLYQCNPLLAQTNHSKGHNHHSASIAVHGDLSRRPMTSLERELVYAGMLTLKHYLPHIKYIVGHNEQGKTSCPCTSMNQIRADILTIENEIEFRRSVAYDNELASKVMARVSDIYRKSIDPTHKYNAAARGKIRKMAQSMEKDGLFNPVDMAQIKG